MPQEECRLRTHRLDPQAPLVGLSRNTNPLAMYWPEKPPTLKEYENEASKAGVDEGEARRLIWTGE